MIHENSREAYNELDLGKRQKDVLEVFKGYPGPWTDRAVMKALHRGDMNQVRPRITELITMRLLEEKGKTRDYWTGRTVRLVGLPEKQMEVF